MSQTQEERNLAARLRRKLAQQSLRLGRTAVAVIRSNPSFGEYLVRADNIIRDSGSLAELSERY